MQSILRKFRLLLSQLRGKFSPSCRVDYINGSDTFPPPLSKAVSYTHLTLPTKRIV